jgi:hypothetical protein
VYLLQTTAVSEEIDLNKSENHCNDGTKGKHQRCIRSSAVFYFDRFAILERYNPTLPGSRKVPLTLPADRSKVTMLNSVGTSCDKKCSCHTAVGGRNLVYTPRYLGNVGCIGGQENLLQTGDRFPISNSREANSQIDMRPNVP